MKLVTEACAGHRRLGQPISSLERLAAHHDGLIALTGGFGGPLDVALRAGQIPQAQARLATWPAIFGDRLYVEIQRHERRGARRRSRRICCGSPMMPTCRSSPPTSPSSPSRRLRRP
jgi:DNA polymerase III alpha subunit